MKRVIILVLAAVLAVMPLASCSKPAAAVNVMALKGPTGMGIVKLLEDSGDKYNITLAGAPDEVSAALINGSADIAAVPVNLAAALYAKTEGKIKVAAINTLGVLYLLENGGQIKTVTDLKGKTVYATGQGSTPEYILRYILAQNNIDPDKDVEIVFLSEHSELAAKMAAGEAAIGMLPEPNVTTVLAKNEKIRVALDFTAEWDKATGGATKLAQGCIVVRSEYVAENKAVFDKFLKDYKASVDYVNGNVKEAAALVEKHQIVPSAAVAEAAIPRSNICYIDGDAMKADMEAMLGVLFAANPKSVGGSLPDDGFYYAK